MDLTRFLAELKARRVHRVAAFYAAGSWGLLQVADVIFPIMGLPDWAITAVLGAAALGFPIALTLAWLFDVTPLGIVETESEASGHNQLVLSPARLVELTLVLILVFLVGFLYFERLNVLEPAPGPVDPAQRPSVAVMPFLTAGDSVELDYFGDGLAEEILNLLSKLDGVDVAARTSSFYFKGKDTDAREIGERLGVTHLLEGSVRLSDETVRVTAQLIQVSDGYHVWSEKFDREFGSFFSLQDEIARKVAQNLQPLLAASSLEIFQAPPTLTPEAYDYYLRARDYLRNSMTEENLERAAELFAKAIERDEQYAEAYAGLCDAQLERYRIRLDRDQYEAANTSCEIALKLDPNSLAVYVARGNLYRTSGEYDLAITEFNKALSLDPESGDALVGLAQTYENDDKAVLAEQTLRTAVQVRRFDASTTLAMGNFLFNTGRVEEAIPYYERITELTPDSAQAYTNLGAAYALVNRFEDAVIACLRSLELEPSAFAYSNAGSSYFFLGRFAEAADMYRKAVEHAPDYHEYWGNLADAYRYSGESEQGIATLYRKAIELATDRLAVNPSDALTLGMTAHYYAGIGDREEALLHLARARALAPRDMYVHYFAAVSYCSLGMYAEAVEALQRALDAGYSSELVILDAGFTPLRDSSDFLALLENPPPDR